MQYYLHRLLALFCIFTCVASLGEEDRELSRELVTDPLANNQLLVVGVPAGLPGVDKDLKMISEIGAHPHYQFIPNQLWSDQSTVYNVSGKLTELATEVDEAGTLFFYFSGHGSRGRISLRDRSMSISEIRTALEKGREAQGPMSRLVLMFDSCYSGSLLDPVRRMLGPLSELSESQAFADTVLEEMTDRDRGPSYWKSLFVFASSRSNETSHATSSGSSFTIALRKAFDEVSAKNGTLNDWVNKTKRLTYGHHPVERFSPLDVGNEKVVP